MATTLATYQSRLEAAETVYDTQMAGSGGAVEYREADGRFIRKSPEELRRYIEYLREMVGAMTSGSGQTLAHFRRAL